MVYLGYLLLIKVVETFPLISCIAIKGKTTEKVNLVTLVTRLKI